MLSECSCDPVQSLFLLSYCFTRYTSPQLCSVGPSLHLKLNVPRLHFLFFLLHATALWGINYVILLTSFNDLVGGSLSALELGQGALFLFQLIGWLVGFALDYYNTTTTATTTTTTTSFSRL